jgi:small subunit ribosomal protein S17e
VDRIKRLSYEVLDKYKSKFGVNFAENKKSLDEVAIVRSKGLKNEVAGYITNFIKKENRETEFSLSKADPSNNEDDLAEDTTELKTEITTELDEKVIEIGVDTTDVQEPNESSEDKTE